MLPLNNIESLFINNAVCRSEYATKCVYETKLSANCENHGPKGPEEKQLDKNSKVEGRNTQVLCSILFCQL